MVMRPSIVGAIGLAATVLVGAGEPWATKAQAVAFQAGQQRIAAQDSSGADAANALVKRYCVTCHNQRMRTAQLSLDTANLEMSAPTPRCGRRSPGNCVSGRCRRPGARALTGRMSSGSSTTWSHLSTGLRRRAPTRAGPRPTASIARNISMRSATCSTWRSMVRPCCLQTMRLSASTTMPTCWRYPLRCWSATCQPLARSAAGDRRSGDSAGD